MAIGHEVANDWQHLPAKALPEAKVIFCTALNTL